MLITVKIFATLRLKFGVASLSFDLDEDITISHLIDLISGKLGEDIRNELLDKETIRPGTMLLIDGKNVIHMNKIQTIIDRDCVVSVFPPSGGG